MGLTFLSSTFAQKARDTNKNANKNVLTPKLIMPLIKFKSSKKPKIIAQKHNNRELNAKFAKA